MGVMKLHPNFVLLLVAGVVGCSRAPSGDSASTGRVAAAPEPVVSGATTPSTIATPRSAAASVSGAAEPAHLVAQSLPLPGASGPASLDFIFYERSPSRVWVPAGSTGSVDVLDTASGAFTRVEGFKTAERERHGKKRTIGPSAGSVGDGFAYIGNRATSEVCPVDVKTLKTGTCVKMSAETDGVVYVAPSKEVWVTLPKEQTIAVLDASKPGTLKPRAPIKLDGSPECYAVDVGRGIFFTNLEDEGRTVAVDIETRKVEATWNPGCGADGPRGVAFDAAHDFVIVACTDHVQVLDAGHGGAPLGRLDTGAGVDNLDYVDRTHLLYVAAGKAARLTVAAVDDKGRLAVVATGQTSEGARNAVADANGTAYVADSRQARLLVFKAKAAP